MTETGKTKRARKYLVRRILVTAAVIALAAAAAMGANAATNGELYECTIGRLISHFTLEDGSEWYVYQDGEGSGVAAITIVQESDSSACPAITVEDEDGRITVDAGGKEQVVYQTESREKTAGEKTESKPASSVELIR